MREPMREPGANALDAAAKRLERAVAALETRLDRRMKRLEQLETSRGGEGHRGALLAELDAARARERALEAIAAEASDALGRAAEEVRAALAEPVVLDAQPRAEAPLAAEPAPSPEAEETDAVELAPPAPSVDDASGEEASELPIASDAEHVDPDGGVDDTGEDVIASDPPKTASRLAKG